MRSVVQPSVSLTSAPRAAVRTRLVLGAMLAVPLLLGGCGLFAPIPTTRGQFIESEDLKKLQPGTSTRADVTTLLGSPTSHGTFDDNTWFYVGEITAPIPLLRPQVQQQQVLVLNFDQGGVLRAVRRLDKNNAHDVTMVGQSTPSPGSDASFMQQLIGNVGRYNPLGLGGDTLGSSGLGSNNGSGHGGTGNTLP